MADARTTALEELLRRDGPLTAAALARALEVSQPTISRLLASAGDRIVRIGRARATRYALTRDIARAGTRWPLYRINPTGTTTSLGQLRALQGDGFFFAPSLPLPAFLHGEFTDGLFPGLPGFWMTNVHRASWDAHLPAVLRGISARPMTLRAGTRMTWCWRYFAMARTSPAIWCWAKMPCNAPCKQCFHLPPSHYRNGARTTPH